MENKQTQRKNNENNEYDASSIKILEGLEAVRKRPGMYIGSTGSEGLHQLIWEVVDNAVDEAMAGFATRVILTQHKDGAISVDDDGRGIPIDIHPKTGKSTVETVLTILHAGGKFDNNSYKISGGLHGVGASCVNALSKSMKVWINRDFKTYFVEFANGGHTVAPLKEIESNNEKEHGTFIKYYPDFTIMEKCDYDENKIINRIKQLAFLNKGIRLIYINEKLNQKNTFVYEGGLKEYVVELNKDKNPLSANIIYGDIKRDVLVNKETEETYCIACEIAFQYNKGYSSSVYSFCNNIHTSEGGSHEEGFKFALAKIINKYAINKKFLKEGEGKLTKEDVIEGLVAIISIKHPNPQYEGQTKRKLGNTEVRTLVNNITCEIFEKYLQENPDDAGLIVRKIMLAAEARKKSQEIREITRRKSPFESNNLPGKLADCSSKDVSICEMYIVEGDSAGGSAKLGRNREFQAILPLRGKILNVEKAASNKIFDNQEIASLIHAIGIGVASELDMTKLRYNRIIIMTDADVDGAHIRILMLTFFFRYMKKLIEEGHVYIAQPPLYKFARGKNVKYAYSDQQLEEFKKENGEAKYTLQRYKGLGEMNPEQLWETTMDPVHRILLKVTIEDAIKADQQFAFLMGQDVGPRKDFIAKNAKFVKNIDA